MKRDKYAVEWSMLSDEDLTRLADSEDSDHISIDTFASLPRFEGFVLGLTLAGANIIRRFRLANSK
jgi:hypothetical protein